MNKLARASLALCCALIAMPALADIADGVNQIRRKGCDGRPGVAKPLSANRELNAVAQEWSKGGRLRDALARAEFRATNSASMHVEGSRDEQTLLDVLQENYCDTIVDATFNSMGIFQRGDAVWIVVAAPFVTPSIKDADTVAQKVLSLVNAARGKARKCGRTEFKAAPPLTLSASLNRAALIHSQDMAKKGFFEHQGSDGSKPSERVTRVGYQWRTAGENIAIGAETPEAVVRGWVDSPGHCANLMSPTFTEMGIAFAVERKSEAGIHWTQVFAAPK